MYQSNNNLSLTILGLFIVINVAGASLNKNQTSKEATDNTTTQRGIESSDHGELEIFLLIM